MHLANNKIAFRDNLTQLFPTQFSATARNTLAGDQLNCNQFTPPASGEKSVTIISANGDKQRRATKFIFMLKARLRICWIEIDMPRKAWPALAKVRVRGTFGGQLTFAELSKHFVAKINAKVSNAHSSREEESPCGENEVFNEKFVPIPCLLLFYFDTERLNKCQVIFLPLLFIYR
jgi:hypothetical protein